MPSPLPETALVIDHDWRVLVATQDVLERAGYRVTTRDRMSGAVNTLMRDKPTLLLIEPDMPTMSGDSLIKIVTSSERRPATLLILHSALPSHELYERAQSCGADGYVQKSEPASRLVAQISHWSARARSGASSARMRAASEAYTSAEADAPATAAVISEDAPPRPLTPRVVEDAPARPLTPRPKPTVLFVDDDPSILKIYRREFSADDITPVFVQSGELAYRLIQSEAPPDVIVCDLLMPSVSGADLYEKALVEDASWRKRFIFTTGFGSVSHISSFVESVEARVFKKPIDMAELREAIRYAALTARIFTPRARGAQPARSL